MRRIRLKRASEHASGAALVLFLLGVVLTLIFSPLGRLAHDLAQTAPWVAVSVVVSEVFWIVGAACMVAAIGGRVGNPLRLRGRWQEITTGITRTPLFWCGFWLNAVGALGTALAVAIGTAVALPAYAWPGGIGFALLDILATIAARSGLLASRATQRLEVRDA